MGPGISGKAFDLVSFNNSEDTIFRVETQVNGKMKNCLCKKIEVKAGPTDHRMAQNVRDLGLETAKSAIGSKRAKRVPSVFIDSSEKIVSAAIKGIEKGKLHVYPGIFSKITWWANKFWPFVGKQPVREAGR